MSTYDSYQDMVKQNWEYSLYFDGDEVPPEHLKRVEEDDFLLLAAVLSENKTVMRYLAEKYSTTPEVVHCLLSQDKAVFFGLLYRNTPGPRVETYSKRAIARLKVMKKNHDTLQCIIDRENPNRGAYFDIGCLFGLQMYSAASMGFTHVHGCELDDRLFARSRDIKSVYRSIREIDYQYFEDDVCRLDLKYGFYDLITLNNVLEHTPDLDETIAQISRMLAPGGVCYVFQNAYPSLIYLLKEPHYGVPGVMCLPRDLTIELLASRQKQGKFSYCVTEWPTYEGLQEVFERYGLEYEWLDEGLECRGNRILSRDEVSNFQEKIFSEFDSVFRSCMTDVIHQRVKGELESLFQTMNDELKAGSKTCMRKYLSQNWHIMLRKK